MNNYYDRLHEIIVNSIPDWNDVRKGIVFLGGYSRYASVQNRCCQIARGLNCDYLTDISNIKDVPENKRIIICVKPNLTNSAIEELSKKALIIWDLHDHLPPDLESIDHIICSTEYSKKYINKPNAWLIPHHHCNFENIINPIVDRKKATWIGRSHWMPNMHLDLVDYVNANNASLATLRGLLRSMSIGYIFRSNQADTLAHISLNPGIKAINNMGFGIPSVAPKEPAYEELASEGVIICEENEGRDFLLRLIKDDYFYSKWRVKAFEVGRKYHLRNIVMKYAHYIKSL